MTIVHTSTTIAGRRWKWLFQIMAAFVVFACFYGLALRITWHYDVAGHPHAMAAYQVLSPMLFPMFWAFLSTSVSLLCVSPFFLRSLRSTALMAWTVGATGLLCAGCLFFMFR